MKLYRYLTEQELKHIIANETDMIGSVYSDKENYKRVNSHNYKKDVKYLHFYFAKKEISRINRLGFKGSSVCYVCEFEIPFYVIFPYIGIGKYDGYSYDNPLDKVYEVALPAKKMKQKYLVNYEIDKNSGPINFGPIIKFDKRLFYDDVVESDIVNDKEEQTSEEKLSLEDVILSVIKEEPLAIKAIKKELEESEEMGK